MMDVYWTEVARARFCAKQVAYDTPPDEANALMLWAALQGAAVHDEFEEALFREHPKVHPKLQMFLFKTKATRDEVRAAVSASSSAAKESAAAQATAKTILARMDRLENRMNSFQDGGNGGGGGGGKRNNNRRGKRKQGDDDNGDEE